MVCGRVLRPDSGVFGDFVSCRHSDRDAGGRRGAPFALAAMDLLALVVIAGAVLARILPWPVLPVVIAIPQVSQVRLVLQATEPGPLHLGWLNGVNLPMQFGVLMMVGLLAGTALR